MSLWSSIKKIGSGVGKVFNKVVKPIVRNIPIIGKVVDIGEAVIGGVKSFIPSKEAEDLRLEQGIGDAIDAQQSGIQASYGGNIVPQVSGSYSGVVIGADGLIQQGGISNSYGSSPYDLPVASQAKVDALKRALAVNGITEAMMEAYARQNGII